MQIRMQIQWLFYSKQTYQCLHSIGSLTSGLRSSNIPSITSSTTSRTTGSSGLSTDPTSLYRSYKDSRKEDEDNKKEDDKGLFPRIKWLCSVWYLQITFVSEWNLKPILINVNALSEKEDPSQKSAAIRNRRKRESRRPTGKITPEDIHVSLVIKSVGEHSY